MLQSFVHAQQRAAPLLNAQTAGGGATKGEIQLPGGIRPPVRGPVYWGMVSDEIKEAVVDAEPAEEIRRLALELGMISLVADGIGKAVAGRVDLMQVLGACSR